MGCHFTNALKKGAFQFRGGDDSSSGADMISSTVKAGNLYLYIMLFGESDADTMLVVVTI